MSGEAGSGAGEAAPILHATLIAARREGRWCGVLLQGPSGAGKSDLALRAVALGWRLVADDRVRAWISGGALFGAAPARLRGLLEVRGVGVVALGALPLARIVLAVQADARPERSPETACWTMAGVSLPSVRLDLHAPSAPEALGRALDGVLRARFDSSGGQAI